MRIVMYFIKMLLSYLSLLVSISLLIICYVKARGESAVDISYERLFFGVIIVFLLSFLSLYEILTESPVANRKTCNE